PPARSPPAPLSSPVPVALSLPPPPPSLPSSPPPSSSPDDLTPPPEAHFPPPSPRVAPSGFSPRSRSALSTRGPHLHPTTPPSPLRACAAFPPPLALSPDVAPPATLELDWSSDTLEPDWFAHVRVHGRGEGGVWGQRR